MLDALESVLEYYESDGEDEVSAEARDELVGARERLTNLTNAVVRQRQALEQLVRELEGQKIAIGINEKGEKWLAVARAALEPELSPVIER